MLPLKTGAHGEAPLPHGGRCVVETFECLPQHAGEIKRLWNVMYVFVPGEVVPALPVEFIRHFHYPPYI